MYVCMYMYLCMYVCMYVCARAVSVSTYVITYVRGVSLLSLGCPSRYEEEMLKKNTLTKLVPRTQLKRNDTLLFERIDLGLKYDAWLADHVPDVTNRLKRLCTCVC